MNDRSGARSKSGQLGTSGGTRTQGLPDLGRCSVDERHQDRSLASKLMFVFMSFETGHPAFAFIAMDWNLASSITGIFAATERCTDVMANPSPFLSMTTSDLLSNCSGSRCTIPSIRTNDIGKTGGVSCAKQLFRIRVGLFAGTAEEGIGVAVHRVALGRDRALALAQAAAPGGRSETFHGSSSLHCRNGAGLGVGIIRPRAAGLHSHCRYTCCFRRLWANT